MRQRTFGCAAILTLLMASACSMGVEEVRGSILGVDAKVSGIRNGTRLMLVGERTGPLSEESVTGDWVQFRVSDNNRVLTDAPDQCLSIIQSDGQPVSAGKFPLTFRHDLWIRASQLQEQEAQLRNTSLVLQNEISRIETDRDEATEWLERNADIHADGKCARPQSSARPAMACVPEDATARAAQFCKDAVVDCAVIGMTMGKPGEAMFDSSFLGNMAAQACSLQTANVVGDDYGIAALLAKVMKDPAVQSAAQSLAAEATNPQKMESFAQAVLAHPGFAACVPMAERTCQTKFRRWQAQSGQRVARCRSATQTATTAHDKIAQLNQRRVELDRELAPIRQELGTLRNGGSVTLRQGC